MRSCLLSILLLFSFANTQGQDMQFSQYFSASLFLNPAFASAYNEPSAHINHKRQLQRMAVINELTQVSLIVPIKPGNQYDSSLGGIGAMFYNERSGIDGVFQNTAAFLTYSHNFKFGLLSSDVLSVGIQVGYENRGFNFSNLSWGSQYNPFLGFDETLPTSVTEFDNVRSAVVVNAGLMYHYNPSRNYLLYKYSAFSGIAVTNLNRPYKSFSIGDDRPDPMLVKYNGGLEMKWNKLYVTPNLLFLYLRGNYQFNAGVNFAYSLLEAVDYQSKGNQLLFGAWYRFRDSFIFMGGVTFSSLSIRASYDLNSNLFVPNRFINISQNSFELSLQYYLSRKSKYRSKSNPLF